MSAPELIDYIQEQTQQGVTAQELRESLMEAGWSELDIENGLHDVAAGLRPATPGTSIHEDLAQVRGMVAHLATRVKSIEATLASVPALPAQQHLSAMAELPSSFVGADHELSAPVKAAWLGTITSLLVMVAVAVLLGNYAARVVARNTLAPLSYIIIAAVAALLLLVVGLVFMRRRHSWAASLCTASAVALWAADLMISWRVYHFMEWTTALAVGALLIVLAGVVGRWIARLSH